MENFFYEENFCSDLGDLIYHLMGSTDDEEQVIALPEDWSIKVQESVLEPIFQTNAKDMDEMFFNNNEDRYPEDEDDKIIKALKECVDFEKLNSMIPKLYYPNNKFVTITKADLLEFIY